MFIHALDLYVFLKVMIYILVLSPSLLALLSEKCKTCEGRTGFQDLAFERFSKVTPIIITRGGAPQSLRPQPNACRGWIIFLSGTPWEIFSMVYACWPANVPGRREGGFLPVFSSRGPLGLNLAHRM